MSNSFFEELTGKKAQSPEAANSPAPGPQSENQDEICDCEACKANPENATNKTQIIQSLKELAEGELGQVMKKLGLEGSIKEVQQMAEEVFNRKSSPKFIAWAPSALLGFASKAEASERLEELRKELTGTNLTPAQQEKKRWLYSIQTYKEAMDLALSIGTQSPEYVTSLTGMILASIAAGLHKGKHPVNVPGWVSNLCRGYDPTGPLFEHPANTFTPLFPAEMERLKELYPLFQEGKLTQKELLERIGGEWTVKHADIS